MKDKRSKYSVRSESTKLSLNDDRGDAFWQIERGRRYGNKRHAMSRAKVLVRRKERRELKKDLLILD